MGKLQLIGLVLLLVGGLVSCKTTDIDAVSKATTYTANINAIDTYIASQNWTAKPTSVTSNSGLYMALTKASSSTVSPQEGQELEFTYTLSVLGSATVTSGTGSTATSTTVISSTVVDAAYATDPTFIPFKKGILKAGLEEGLLLMHEGDQAVLLMPSILAYGDVATSVPPIPANSPVRFDVTLNRTRTEDQQMDEYITATGLKLTEKTTTGLRFFRTTVNATSPLVDSVLTKGAILTVRYAAKQLHAKSVVRYDTVSSTSINTSSLTGFVSGFTEGLRKLRVGEKATLLVPSSIGYGATGLVDTSTQPGVYIVSPYAPLRYDIEVVSAK